MSFDHLRKMYSATEQCSAHALSVTVGLHVQALPYWSVWLSSRQEKPGRLQPQAAVPKVLTESDTPAAMQHVRWLSCPYWGGVLRSPLWLGSFLFTPVGGHGIYLGALMFIVYGCNCYVFLMNWPSYLHTTSFFIVSYNSFGFKVCFVWYQYLWAVCLLLLYYLHGRVFNCPLLSTYECPYI